MDSSKKEKLLEIVKHYNTLKERQIAAYIQHNVDYFIKVFNKIENGSTIVWNWWAFFFPGIYLLYRRSYLYGLIAIILKIFTMRIPFAGIIFGFILGLFANYLIYINYKASLNEAQKRDLNEQETLEFLYKEGGVNNFIIIWGIIASGYEILWLLNILYQNVRY